MKLTQGYFVHISKNEIVTNILYYVSKFWRKTKTYFFSSRWPSVWCWIDGLVCIG